MTDKSEKSRKRNLKVEKLAPPLEELTDQQVETTHGGFAADYCGDGHSAKCASWGYPGSTT